MGHMEYRFERYASGLWTLRYWLYEETGFQVAYHAFSLDVTEIPLIASAMMELQIQEQDA